MTAPPPVNTHIHLPPNFSAFATVEEAVAAAAAAGLAALGASNFFDQRVYGRFRDQALAAGIQPLFGLEFITWDKALAVDGVRVNDPANPGRIYLTGKAIDPNRTTARTAALTATIRADNDRRADLMVRRLADWFARQGLDSGLTAARLAADVAARAQVPVEWVSLQERHIAQGFQEAVFRLPVARRAELLERVWASAAVDPDDAAAVGKAIRDKLLKAGQVGFAPEAQLSFEAARAQVLELGGIPCYPVLADGADPVCPFEYPPAELAAALRQRGLHAAELIPGRNRLAQVEAHVQALTAAGLIVLAGTEHNTLERLPLDPGCADGPLPDHLRQLFWQGTCVVAAHQYLTASGEPGYVDAAGRPLADDRRRRAELVELGAALLTAGPNEGK
ncbi:MAG: hypothetical protein LBK42_14635 [Propionibacteriaceae bacterium]|nr:hypothetical protein [Propionibacteriaceae bacterium]